MLLAYLSLKLVAGAGGKTWGWMDGWIDLVVVFFFFGDTDGRLGLEMNEGASGSLLGMEISQSVSQSVAGEVFALDGAGYLLSSFNGNAACKSCLGEDPCLG